MARAAAKTKLNVQDVLIEHLHPNPWNPNSMDERTFEATRESVGTFGFLDPVTVRPHPDIDGQFQIIDGEHRWRVMQELGHEHVPVIVVNLDTPAAKKFTIVANETRGRAEKIALADLLADLSADYGDDLITALPYSLGELGELVGLAGNDWRNLDGEHDPTGGAEGGAGDEGWTTLTARIPDSVHALWLRALAQIGSEHELPASDALAAGQVLEILLAEFLAG